MNQDVEINSVWKSKKRFPEVGFYIVKIVGNENRPVIDTVFTATGWKNKHSVVQKMKKDKLLEEYVRIK